MNRCLVCNNESFNQQFCSQECEDAYNTLMEAIEEAESLIDIDEHAEDERMRREENLK